MASGVVLDTRNPDVTGFKNIADDASKARGGLHDMLAACKQAARPAKRETPLTLASVRGEVKPGSKLIYAAT